MTYTPAVPRRPKEAYDAISSGSTFAQVRASAVVDDVRGGRTGPRLYVWTGTDVPRGLPNGHAPRPGVGRPQQEGGGAAPSGDSGRDRSGSLRAASDRRVLGVGRRLARGAAPGGDDAPHVRLLAGVREAGDRPETAAEGGDF